MNERTSGTSLQIGLTDAEVRDVRMTRSGASATVWIDGLALPVRRGTNELTIDGRTEQICVVIDRDTAFVHALGRAWTLQITDPAEAAQRQGPGLDAAVAPMPGVLVSLSSAAGNAVTAGQVVAVIESMKMQTEIKAPRDGVVDRVLVAVGDSFSGGAALVTLEPLDADEGSEGE